MSSVFIARLVTSEGLVHRPATLAEVIEVTEAYLAHYNDERLNQARSCGNQPPRVACPTFPTLPAVPQMVDPDRWLLAVDQRAFARTISLSGHLTITHQAYSVSRKLAGQRVACWLNAAQKRFDIWQPGGQIKSLPIKGVHAKIIPTERGCGADDPASALGIPPVFAHSSQACPGSPVGLNLLLRQDKRITPTRTTSSRLVVRLSLFSVGPGAEVVLTVGKPRQDQPCSLFSPLLS